MVVLNIFFSPLQIGNDPIWRAYFSDGLVQPPTRLRWTPRWMKVQSCLWSRPLAPHSHIAPQAEFYCVTVENHWKPEGSSTMEPLNIEMLPAAQNSMFMTSLGYLHYVPGCSTALHHQIQVDSGFLTLQKKTPLAKKNETGSWFLSDFPLEPFFPKLFDAVWVIVIFDSLVPGSGDEEALAGATAKTHGSRGLPEFVDKTSRPGGWI